MIVKGTKHEAYLPLRQVALDNDVYYTIKQAYERFSYAGYKKTYKAIRLDVYNINREKVKWFIDYYRRCEMNRFNYTRAPLQPIESDNINKRCQIDLIDIKVKPSGLYNWILTTKDHFDKFITLWPLRNKTV
jgi:hypothetical protein